MRVEFIEEVVRTFSVIVFMRLQLVVYKVFIDNNFCKHLEYQHHFLSENKGISKLTIPSCTSIS